ncbi:transaldolase [Buchnera aphidicola]|uniref:transaldolase n=1 Tax=Buchnera aphidicola TaxID=9 RepID=UPI003464811E
MNQLEALKKMTIVVVDSGDIGSITRYTPQDATTNPTLILQAMSLSYYQDLIDESINYAKKRKGDYKTKIVHATDKIAVSLGIKVLNLISGKVSIEVDARLSFNQELCIKKANKLINMFEEEGIDRSRILIKLAATWEGIKAAEELKKNNINCNLTLLFSFIQAQACAEAGVYLISPFVGRIYDWYHERTPIIPYQYKRDPGVMSVHKIYNYYKSHGYSTIIMGASFRKKEQILGLAGCDRLTISPSLLAELQSSTDVIERKLFGAKNVIHLSRKITESDFRWIHNQDVMGVEKLSDGIRKFGDDQIKLEQVVEDRF